MKFILELSDSDFEGKGWERPLTKFSFNLILPFEYDSDEWWDWDDEVLLDQVIDMEEYGVHDYTASGDKDGNWLEFGFHSYEIKQDKWEEVVEKWHKWFEDQGFTPGKIESELLEEETE